MTLAQLLLPAVVAAALVWCLVLALLQRRTERTRTPMFVWREASHLGWTDWTELVGVSPSTNYTDVLAAVRNVAGASANAVQFASVVRPEGAPDFTVQVLFTSKVRDAHHDPIYSTTH